jgi:N-acetylglutamate synthase-like GNAT family acetyltransferase
MTYQQEPNIEIRRFCDEDARVVASLICRNLREINSKDYSKEEIERLVLANSAEQIKINASQSHFYVALSCGKMIGCGAITETNDKKESIIKTIFVLPEYHGKGIGKKLIGALEQDEFFLQAKQIELFASITAIGFYEHLGYSFCKQDKTLDENGLYQMEKRRDLK